MSNTSGTGSTWRDFSWSSEPTSERFDWHKLSKVITVTSTQTGLFDDLNNFPGASNTKMVQVECDAERKRFDDLIDTFFAKGTPPAQPEPGKPALSEDDKKLHAALKHGLPQIMGGMGHFDSARYMPCDEDEL